MKTVLLVEDDYSVRGIFEESDRLERKWILRDWRS